MLILGAKIQTFLLCMINVARFARNIMRLLEGFFYHCVCLFLWNFRPGPFVEFPGQLFRLEDE